MKSKKIICGALAATLTLGVALSGCSLVSTRNDEDMAQIVAEVNIASSSSLKDEGLDTYAEAITTTKIVKRDLVASFVNVGSSYISNGYTYETVFTMLVNSLTSNAVLTQYSTLYMLKEKSKTDSNALSVFTDSSKTEAEKYEYLLGGENSDDVKLAKYSLYSSINSALDTLEKNYLDEEDSYEGSDTRTTPDNVDTLKDDYYPQNTDGSLNYGIYTGYEGYLYNPDWEYEELTNSTRSSRSKAYAAFVAYLKQNYLVTSADTTPNDVLSLEYVQQEYVNQLQQVVVNNYYDLFSSQQEDIIKSVEGGEYTFLKDRYTSLLEEQERNYSSSSDDFESGMSGMSSSSFILYSPSTEEDTVADSDGNYGTFGFVYNILLPFSTNESNRLTQLSNFLSDDVIDDNQYYVARNELLKNITTTDQRSAWFNGETDYSFLASDEGLTYATTKGTNTYYGNADRSYLFFKNNLLKTTMYESLDKYIGDYSYNGTVKANKDGSYTLTPNKLSIDGMLDEFSSYVDYVLGGNKVTVNKNDNYYNVTDFTYADSDEIDYSNFVYASGNISFDYNRANTLTTTSEQYLAMSAVNELQYAYTTDTSVLSQYVGYTVSAYDTSYIKEFEYAAKWAIKQGVGTFVVCAGDYGWHLIYVTDAFETAGGETYKGLDWSVASDRINTDGTFENIFYTWIKEAMLSEVSTIKQSSILETYGGTSSVTLYTDRYQDLLELDS
jgi:hypothetical protein